MSRKAIHLDATSLRGLAHPLRVKILGILREHGPATSTLLAERLGQSTGATSYHLRQLAQYGFVAEDTSRGSGRERWWQAAHTQTVLDRIAGMEDPEATEEYLRAIASAYTDRMLHWVGEAVSMPVEWQDVGTLSDQSLVLTPAEGKRLHEEVQELFQRYRARDLAVAGETPEDARPVVLQVQILPFPHPQTGA